MSLSFCALSTDLEVRLQIFSIDFGLAYRFSTEEKPELKDRVFLLIGQRSSLDCELQ